jgi:hypothetical protein
MQFFRKHWRKFSALYDPMKSILSQRREELELIAVELIRKETLTQEELSTIPEGSEEVVNLYSPVDARCLGTPASRRHSIRKKAAGTAARPGYLH